MSAPKIFPKGALFKAEDVGPFISALQGFDSHKEIFVIPFKDNNIKNGKLDVLEYVEGMKKFIASRKTPKGDEEEEGLPAQLNEKIAEWKTRVDDYAKKNPGKSILDDPKFKAELIEKANKLNAELPHLLDPKTFPQGVHFKADDMLTIMAGFGVKLPDTKQK